jgi:DNA-binding beta-propeller fold protein YncE
MTTRRIVKTATFPPGSKPWMLRVSPDGKEVWGQADGNSTNVVLNADDLSTLATMPCGKDPVRNGWSPDASKSLVLNAGDAFAQLFDARTRRELGRLTVGPGASNVGFTKDGRTAFVVVTGADAIAVVDMVRIEVVDQLKAGRQPQGLIIR